MRFDRYLLRLCLGKIFTHLCSKGHEEAGSLLAACGFTRQDCTWIRDNGRTVVGVYFENDELKHYVHYMSMKK